MCAYNSARSTLRDIDRSGLPTESTVEQQPVGGR
jgi:hypothetical protein